VDIGGRRYVDGGIWSGSNLDVLADEGLDVVIALNPMSSLHVEAPRTLGERLASAVRQNAGRRLGSEAKRVRAAGTEVILIQPTVHDLDAMGSNLMSRGRRNLVIETAIGTMTAHLKESPLGERLAELPSGVAELVRRPPGPSSSWPDFRDLAAARWESSGFAAVAV
jgi:NTE family protein